MEKAANTMRFLFLAMTLFCTVTLDAAPSFARDTANPGGESCSMDDYFEALGISENSGSYDGCNSIGCCGKYQFCPSTLAQYGYTREEFLANPHLQEEAIRRFTMDNYNTLVRGGAGQYVGTVINGVRVTWSGLLGAAHLGGAGGVLRMLRSGGTYNPNDGHTSLTDYMQRFAGFGSYAGEGEGGCDATWSPDIIPNRLCDPSIMARISEQVDGTLARRNEFVRTNMSPPPSLSQVANTPCMSRELQRITNQFAFFTQDATNQVTSLMTGPISGILGNTFRSSFESINNAALGLQRMLDFQGMASRVLGNLLQSLGGGNGFASETCGMMVDMLLNYIQCEHPIKMPNLGNITGPLNNLLANVMPQGCAGQALTEAMSGLAQMRSREVVAQPVGTDSSGALVLGIASETNERRRIADEQ